MDEIRFLNSQADETRAAAAGAGDVWRRQALEQLASHYEREARRLDAHEMDASLEDRMDGQTLGLEDR